MNFLLIYLIIGAIIGIYVSNNISDDDIYNAFIVMKDDIPDEMQDKFTPQNIKNTIILISIFVWPYVIYILNKKL